MLLTDEILAQNTSGRAISLQDMRITSISPMGPRADVTRVSITGCGLSDLSFVPLVFPNASNVNLSDNRLDAASLQPLRGLKRLTVLNLAGNKISEFPCEVLRSPTLKALVLAKNRISAIPDLASALGLSGEPKEADPGYARQLNTLVLSGNPVSRVEEEFAAFPALRKVSFSHCELEAFPVVRSPGIRELRLSNNRIEAIPRFERLQSVNLLDLGGNRISGREGLAALSQATRLKQLTLSGNPCMESAAACRFLVETFKELNKTLHINGGPLSDFEMGKNRGAGAREARAGESGGRSGNAGADVASEGESSAGDAYPSPKSDRRGLPAGAAPIRPAPRKPERGLRPTGQAIADPESRPGGDPPSGSAGAPSDRSASGKVRRRKVLRMPSAYLSE